MATQTTLPALRQQELLDRYIGFLLLSRTPNTVEIHREKGHDAWVVGNEPVVAVDWFGATHYTERR